MKFASTCLLMILGTSGVAAASAQAPTAPGPTPVSAPAPAPKSALERAVRRGNVLIAGQPSAADLGALRPRGIARVINLRTPEEMNDRSVVPFDEAALLAGSNVDYVVIPIGGANYPLRPEALEAYAKALADAKGEVLLHCASGGRANTLHAAYEVKYLGRDPDEAMRALEPSGGWPLPIERLTGIKLKVELR
jgi:protein tyrosine phosphatase (PTP) superfamily phosphohydrolase (DUF442 family)